MWTRVAAACILAGAALAQSVKTTGTLRRQSAEQWTIETDDHRTVWFDIDPNDPARNPGLQPNDRVEIESITRSDSSYLLIGVRRLSGPSPSSARPAIAPDPTRDAAIAQAWQAAKQFMDTLPSFQVQRRTARYEKAGRRAPWTLLDTLTSTLAYRDGRESYSDIRVDDREFTKSMEDVDGLHSTGEFGQILLGILGPKSGTSFAKPSRAAINGRKALKYGFSIPREFSSWRLRAASQQYFTAYSGTLWIDVETNRVLRLEMQAKDVPKAFPLDTAEINLDNGFVQLAAGERHLLPTQSEALNCVRGSSVCFRNTTAFTSYVKFEADSKILFDDVK